MSARPATQNEMLTRVTHDDDPQMRPLDFRLIGRLLTYTRPYAWKRNWLAVLVIGRSIQLPILAWLLGAVIGGPIAGGDATGLAWGVTAYLAIAVFTDFTFHFRQRLALELGESVVHDLRNAVFAHLMRMPMSFFHKTKLGRIISRMTSDVDIVRTGVQDVLFVSLVQGGQMLIAGALMLYYDWALFSVVVAMAPFLWMMNSYFRVKLSQATREAQESFSRVTATLAESVTGIRVTQGFVRQDVNAGLFRNLILDHSRSNVAVGRTSAALAPLLEVNSQFFIAVLLILGGWRTLHPEIQADPGNLITFFFLTNLFFQPIQSLGHQYNQALLAMAGAERLFRMLDAKPEWEDAPDAKPWKEPAEGRVEFRNVYFGYDGERMVLHDVSFEALPGQTIALVGHTGSGKSSIINLITKFYLPTRGQVLIDGQEIRDLRSDSLHRHMGIVPQMNFLFSGTLLDNIRIAKPDATEDQVREACAQLDCLDLIETLPGGLTMVVGEKGSGLSLGQRQLVCFARAMLADPRILILDEATSSLDSMTEARLQKALEKLLAGRTSFVVAHRLSTIRNADVVLVLEHGRIIERGRHDNLVALDGHYASLYRQFTQLAGVS